MANTTFIQDNIGETLLITLYMKSLETKKDNPIIRDETACKLVDSINYDFEKFKKGIGSSVGVAIRANYFDDVTKDFIIKNDHPIIVIIGCGLDSRMERIGSIANEATFYQLDIPEVMNIREKLIPKKENEHYIHASMLETEWMETLQKEHPNGDFLFVIEGILMYFNESDVKSVFVNLSQYFSKAEILFDIINVWMSKNSHRHDTVKFTNAQFIYGTDDNTIMEQWDEKLKLKDVKLFTDFPTWKRAGIKAWFIRYIRRFKTSGRMLRYEIK